MFFWIPGNTNTKIRFFTIHDILIEVISLVHFCDLFYKVNRKFVTIGFGDKLSVKLSSIARMGIPGIFLTKAG